MRLWMVIRALSCLMCKLMPCLSFAGCQNYSQWQLWALLEKSSAHIIYLHLCYSTNCTKQAFYSNGKCDFCFKSLYIPGYKYVQLQPYDYPRRSEAQSRVHSHRGIARCHAYNPWQIRALLDKSITTRGKYGRY